MNKLSASILIVGPWLLKATACLLSFLAVVYMKTRPEGEINWHICSMYWNTVAVTLWLYVLFTELNERRNQKN